VVEDSVLTDPVGTFRRVLEDGTIVDLSSFDEFGIVVAFEQMPDGRHRFIDFALAD
jgi:hypothetical protein